MVTWREIIIGGAVIVAIAVILTLGAMWMWPVAG
jgi:hypothetical protein